MTLPVLPVLPALPAETKRRNAGGLSGVDDATADGVGEADGTVGTVDAADHASVVRQLCVGWRYFAYTWLIRGFHGS